MENLQNKKNIKINGSFSTATFFKMSNGDEIKCEITLETECTVSVRCTFYKYHISIRKFRHKKFEYLFTSYQGDESKKYSEYLTEQQFYSALHNHWENINPFHRFCNSYVNSEMANFTVKQIPLVSHIRILPALNAQ